MNRISDRDFDYLDFDDSDIESPESSDDEIDILLHGTPEQKRKLCRRQQSKGDNSSSEDEFEKEMNAELNGHVKALEKKRGSVSSEAGPSTESAGASHDDEPQKYYDDVYFDSDEEEMFTEGDKRSQKKELSNDELLYDPEADEDNERWIEKQRRSYLPKSQASSEKEKKKPLPNSDAVLDCPACMTTLCLDCQRHDTYTNQYRAMFVMNCTVDYNELLKYPQANNKRRKKKQKSSATQDVTSETDKFHPVKCNECNTVVAVYDTDEIYHFFNVLASY